MKILRQTMLFIMIAILVISIGCSGTPVHIDSTPQRPIDNTKGSVITAESCGFQLFLWIPIRVNNRQARAYKKLLMIANGDYITDVKMKERWIYGFVGTAYCTEFEATAYPYLTAN